MHYPAKSVQYERVATSSSDWLKTFKSKRKVLKLLGSIKGVHILKKSASATKETRLHPSGVAAELCEVQPQVVEIYSPSSNQLSANLWVWQVASFFVSQCLFEPRIPATPASMASDAPAQTIAASSIAPTQSLCHENLPPPRSPNPTPVSHPRITSGSDVRETCLISAKVALNADESRPPRPAWTTLFSGYVACACVANATDVVISNASFDRLGRLPLGDTLENSVQALCACPASAGDGYFVLASGGNGYVVIVDASEEALVPMRKHMTDDTPDKPRIIATLMPPDPAVGRPIACLAVAECRDGLAVFGSFWDERGFSRVVVWVLRTGFESRVRKVRKAGSGSGNENENGEAGVEGEDPAGDDVDEVVVVRGAVCFSSLAGARIPSLDAAARDDGLVSRVVITIDDDDGGKGNVIALDLRFDLLLLSEAAMEDAYRSAIAEGWTDATQHVINLRNWGLDIPMDIYYGDIVRCEYGRVLCALDGGGQWVIFGGEDDRVYRAALYQLSSPRGAVGRSTGPLQPQRAILVQHHSFVSGVAIRDGMVASAGWDGRLLISPIFNERGETASECRVASEPVVVATAGAGKTFWAVEWPERDILHVASLEGVSKRCLLHKIELQPTTNAAVCIDAAEEDITMAT